MSIGLEATGHGLRTRLDEADWAALAARTGIDLDTAELRPLPGTTASDVATDDALVEAARLALGDALVAVSAVSGSGRAGALARIGTDLTSVGTAVRALVPAPDGSGPVGVPGVEVGANVAGNLVAEVMRLFPAAGLQRHVDREPVTLSHDLAAALVRALKDGKDRVAETIAERAGFDDVPEVMRSLAHGTSASLTLTVRVAGRSTVAMRHWLLADAGWVQLAVRQRQVTHLVSSRDEVRDEIVRLLTGAFDAAGTLSAAGGASDG